MENKEIRDEVEIDIGEIVSLLLSRIWFIVILAVTVGLIFFAFSKFIITPEYSSSTKIYVLSKSEDSSSNSSLTYADLQVGSTLTKDYLELVKSRTVLVQVIAELGLNLSEDSLSEMISVSNSSDTRIITITVSSEDPYEAQQVANKVREIASEHICSVMDLEAVNIVDEADIPTAPSSPNVMKNTVIGAALGFLAAVAFIVVTYLMNDTIKTPDDVEKYLGVSVLSSIPVLETEDKKSKKKKKTKSGSKKTKKK